jgi:hypothetical protein
LFWRSNAGINAGPASWTVLNGTVVVPKPPDMGGTTLVNYHVADLLNQHWEDLSRCGLGGPSWSWSNGHDDFAHLLTGVVCMEQWIDNGGDGAAYSFVGDRLFVVADVRAHDQIARLLAALREASSSDRAVVPADPPLLTQGPTPDPPFGHLLSQVMIYNIRDLVSDAAFDTFPYPDRVRKITGLLAERVSPDSWFNNGGDVTSTNETMGLLIVSAPSEMQTGVSAELNRLRVPGALADFVVHPTVR